jgi:hypothetical protein
LYAECQSYKGQLNVSVLVCSGKDIAAAATTTTTTNNEKAEIKLHSCSQRGLIVTKADSSIWHETGHKLY